MVEVCEPVLEKTRIRLSKIANEMASAGRLRIYEDVTWHPYCPGASRPFIGRNVYNMFEGFPLSHIRPNGRIDVRDLQKVLSTETRSVVVRLF